MITVELAREKETKRTVRYVGIGPDPGVEMLYVPKGTVEELGWPARLTLTLQPAEIQLAA